MTDFIVVCFRALGIKGWTLFCIWTTCSTIEVSCIYFFGGSAVESFWDWLSKRSWYKRVKLSFETSGLESRLRLIWESIKSYFLSFKTWLHSNGNKTIEKCLAIGGIVFAYALTFLLPAAPALLWPFGLTLSKKIRFGFPFYLAGSIFRIWYMTILIS